MDDARWSLGTLIWVPIAGVLTVVCLIAMVVFFIWWRKERGHYDSGFLLAVSLVCGVVALCVVAGTIWGMWPLEAKYHKWDPTVGVVQEIESRLLSDGNGGMNERFVVTFENGDLRSCDDSRCTQVDEGDTLELICKGAWQWFGTPGYDCNYVSHESN